MREMRLHKREIRDLSVIKEILEECQVLRLGLTDEEGMFIVPVNYGYDLNILETGAKLTLYIHGSGEGRKADALAVSSRVAIEMDCRHEIITGDYTCSYSYGYRSIMGSGTAARLESEDEKRYALERLMAHMSPEAELEFRPEMLERTAVYRIDVEHFTGKERKKKQ